MEKRDSMSKVKIKAILEDKTEGERHCTETCGLKKQNRIIYQDETFQTVLTVQDKIALKRTGEDSIFKCTFDSSLTTDGIYDIKSVNVHFPIKICTKYLVIKENWIEIEYEMILENNPPKEFYYRLEYEVIS